MSVQFKDYYKILGIERSATADEVKKAFRKLAAKHHPDRNAGKKESEEKFKEINEAYEVLGDPEKRRRYDQFGGQFNPGQSINPEDFASIFGNMFGGGRSGGAAGGPRMETFTGGPGGFRASGGGGGFSDFFEALFGSMGRGGASPFDRAEDPFQRGATGHERWGTSDVFNHAAHSQQAHVGSGGDVSSSLTIPLEEAYRGTTRRVAFQRTDQFGRAARQDYEVKIPAGIRDGQKVRLKGQGHQKGSQTGDILIEIRIAPHPRFRLEGEELNADLALTPWEAALGSRVTVTTIDGAVDVRVPPGIQSGKKLRVRGKGWPKRDGTRGDLFLRVMIQIPPEPTAQEREYLEKLAKISKFNPREG